MSRYLHRYGIDPTGVSPSNLVQNEVRTMPRRDRRALVPTYGAFYSKSLRIRDKLTNEVLKSGVHYVTNRLYAETTTEFGQEVYGIIIIIDPKVSDTVLLDYQVVGGKYEDSLPVILELINSVKNDHRGALYSNVSNKPPSVPPVRHLHDIGDIYGFEGLTHAIERTRMTMQLSSVIDYDNYFSYVDRLMVTLAGLGSLLASEVISSHALDINAHSQYLLRAKAETSGITIRTPVPVLPAANAKGVARAPLFQCSPYLCMYRHPQKSMQVVVCRRSDFTGNLDVDATLPGPFSSYQYPSTLAASTGFYWRARYQADDLSWSEWSTPTYFETGTN
jgi:hypothetical protein